MGGETAVESPRTHEYIDSSNNRQLIQGAYNQELCGKFLLQPTTGCRLHGSSEHGGGCWYSENWKVHCSRFPTLSCLDGFVGTVCVGVRNDIRVSVCLDGEGDQSRDRRCCQYQFRLYQSLSFHSVRRLVSTLLLFFSVGL